MLENADENLTLRMRNLIAMLWSEWKELEVRMVEMNDEIERIASSILPAEDCDRFLGSAAGRNCDRSFDRQRSCLPEGSRVRGLARSGAKAALHGRQGSMGSASAVTATCARSWCMELGRLSYDRNETGSPWAHGSRLFR